MEKQHVMLRTGILRTVELFWVSLCFHGNGVVVGRCYWRFWPPVVCSLKKNSRRKITFWRWLCSTVWLCFFFFFFPCMHFIRQIQLVRGFSQWMMCHTEAASTALWISMAAEKAPCRWRCAITFILLTAR